MPQSILYYPSINIHDSPWLRSAVLYWDQVFSIVPDGGFLDYSPEVMYMRERGYYSSISPQVILSSPFADDFSMEVLKRLGRKNNLDQKLCFNKHNAEHLNNQPVLLHRSKISHKLMESMIQSGLLKYVNDCQWLEADPIVADLYMKVLAEFIVRLDERDLVIGTDKKYNLDHIYSRSNIHRGDLLFEVMFHNIFPVPALDTSFESILDFKEKRQDELIQLHLIIQDLEHKIGCCESYEEMKAILNSFRSSWQLELLKAEKMFRGDGVGFVLSNLTTFVADAGGCAGFVKDFISNNSSLRLGAGLTNGLLGVALRYRNYRKKINAEYQSMGFAYVIDAARHGLLKDYDLI